MRHQPASSSGRSSPTSPNTRASRARDELALPLRMLVEQVDERERVRHDGTLPHRERHYPWVSGLRPGGRAGWVPATAAGSRRS